MDVKIMRGRAKKVLFMECSSKVVDLILEIMQKPLGEVLGAISQDSDADGILPGSALHRSLANLQKQGELFKVKSEEAPTLTNQTLGDLLKESSVKQLPSKLEFLRGHNCTHKVMGDIVEVTNNGGGAGAWNANAMFQIKQAREFAREFEVKMTLHQVANGTNGFMLGIAPVDANMSTQNFYSSGGFFLFKYTPIGRNQLYGMDGSSASPELQLTGDVIYMKLTEISGNMLLQFASDCQGYTTALFRQPIPCGNYRPAVCFSFHGQSVTMASLSGSSRQVPKEILKPEIQFIVTNSMEIRQSSSTLAIELIAKNNGESLKGMTSETVRITASILRRLLIGALLGRNDVLDFAFPAGSSPGAGESEDASESSEHSFELAFAAGSNTVASQ